MIWASLLDRIVFGWVDMFLLKCWGIVRLRFLFVKDADGNLKEKRMTVVDVVIPSLLRPTLPICLKHVSRFVPVANIIIITDEGMPIGRIRNKGLAQARTELVAFIDDDILVNGRFKELISFMEHHPDCDAVFGQPFRSFTVGCSVFRAENLRHIGGFPDIDTLLWKNAEFRQTTLSGIFCEHLLGGPLDAIRHSWYWMWHSFHSKGSKTGFRNKPQDCMRGIIRGLLTGKPEYSLSYLLWLIKSLWVFPFVMFSRMCNRGVIRYRLW